jgi:class 3 adenylate cyclase
VSEREKGLAYVAVLKGKHAGERVEITGDQFLIGRGKKADLKLSGDGYISRSHCIIRVKDGDFSLGDLGSANGTFLNGKRIKGIADFLPPSYIAVGRTRLVVMPIDADDESVKQLVDSTFAAEGSIIVPPSYLFNERTEAFLVVDIVQSTQILEQHESDLAKIVSVIGQILERALGKEPEPFLKCTGDGFFACFSKARAAAHAALKLGPTFRKHVQKPVQVSIALHSGTSRLTEERDRTGNDVHCVFDLEKLRHRIHRETVYAHGVHELILMTERFWKKLDEATRAKAMRVGQYDLKGLKEKEVVYLLQR